MPATDKTRAAKTTTTIPLHQWMAMGWINGIWCSNSIDSSSIKMESESYHYWVCLNWAHGMVCDGRRDWASWKRPKWLCSISINVIIFYLDIHCNSLQTIQRYSFSSSFFHFHFFSFFIFFLFSLRPIEFWWNLSAGCVCRMLTIVLILRYNACMNWARLNAYKYHQSMYKKPSTHKWWRIEKELNRP